MKLFIPIIGFFLFLFTLNSSAKTEEYQIYTGDLPPYSFELGKKGIVSEIAHVLLQDERFFGVTQSFPWSRALKKSEREKKVIIFPLAKLPHREKKYLWVGPIVEDRLIFIVNEENVTMYSHINQFKEMKHIGVLQHAPPYFILKKMGFENLDPVRQELLNLRKLQVGRLDATFSTKLLLLESCRQQCAFPYQFRTAMEIGKLELYIALSRDLKDLRDKMQKRLEAFSKTEEYKEIFRRYEIEPCLIKERR